MPKWTEKIEIPDPDQFNNFIEVGQIQAQLASRRAWFALWLSHEMNNLCHKSWWPFKEKNDEKTCASDFIRSEGFDLSCPGNPDPDAEGKRRFRECLVRLMTQLAELIADNEASTILPSKKMGGGSGFPYVIKLSIDQSWWDYILTVKASSDALLKEERRKWKS